jgi:NTE family protein
MTSASRKKVGLALGGGSVRGLAHLGVLAVLERERIPIDFVAGSSVGSLIGALYCAGLEVKQLKELAAFTGWRNFASFTLSTQGLVSFARLERWLLALVGDLQFSDLTTPFAVVATDLLTGRPVVYTEGRLAPVVRASCSVPGIATPVNINGRLMVDGGASDNLPVGAVRALGAEYVIAVDICQPAYRRRWGPFGVAVAAIETLVRRAGGGLSSADCLISPALAGFSYIRFSQGEELIARGADAAAKSLTDVKEALAATN